MSLGYPMGGARPPHVDLASGALTQKSSPYRTFCIKAHRPQANDPKRGMMFAPVDFVSCLSVPSVRHARLLLALPSQTGNLTHKER